MHIHLSFFPRLSLSPYLMRECDSVFMCGWTSIEHTHTDIYIYIRIYTHICTGLCTALSVICVTSNVEVPVGYVEAFGFHEGPKHEVEVVVVVVGLLEDV